jgi:hypothetical protein
MQISLQEAYRITGIYTPTPPRLTHNGKPVKEIDGGINNFYQVIYPDNSSVVVFSPESETPITVEGQP